MKAEINNPITVVLKCRACGAKYSEELGTVEDFQERLESGWGCPHCGFRHCLPRGDK